MTKILYPVKAEPVFTGPEAVHPELLNRPLSEPVRTRRLPVAVVVASGLAGVVAPPDFVPDLRWYAPLSEPVRQRPVQRAALQTAFFTDPASLTLPEASHPDAWARPLSEPRWERRDVNRVLGQQLWTWVNTAPPEVVTLDKWYRPLETPPRRPSVHASQQAFDFRVLTTSYPEQVSLDKWYAALSEPVRPKPVAWRYAGTTVLTQFTVPPEVVTLDKWYRPLGEPVRFRPALLAALQRFDLRQPGTQFPEVVEVESWYRPLGEPVRQARRPLNLPSSSAPVYTAPPPAPDYGWFTALNQPLRALARRPQLDPASVRSTDTPPPPAPVTMDSWWVPLSEPVLYPHLLTAAQVSVVYLNQGLLPLVPDPLRTLIGPYVVRTLPEDV